MSVSHDDPLALLRVADPELWITVLAGLENLERSLSTTESALMVEDIIWGLSLEASFGAEIAQGYLNLLDKFPPAILLQYRNAFKKAAEMGPTLGKLVAQHLPPVLKFQDPELTKRFFQTQNTLLKKGIHLLHEPLACASMLFSAEERSGGEAFLDLLHVVFSFPLTYNRARALSHFLPTAASHLSPARRGIQIRAAYRVAVVSCELVEPFFAGIEKGLSLLSDAALTEFVSIGIEKSLRNQEIGKSFLALESALSRRKLDDLQVSIALSQVEKSLNHYLRARIGSGLSVKATSTLPALIFSNKEPPMVCSDSRFIYLPKEISVFGTRAENLSLYKLLTKLEAGYHEFGTFDFDLEKLTENTPHPLLWSDAGTSDLERFFLSFPSPDLAQDLFTVFENGRIRFLMEKRYPGLVKLMRHLLAKEIKRLLDAGETSEAGSALFSEIVLGKGSALACGLPEAISRTIDPIIQSFNLLIQDDPIPETSGKMVIKLLASQDAFTIFPCLPFGRRVWADLFSRSELDVERLSQKIKTGLDALGIKIYSSELKRHLRKHCKPSTAADLERIILQRVKEPEDFDIAPQRINEILDTISSEMGLRDAPNVTGSGFTGSVFWQPEWDNGISDYLRDHVRVVEKTIVGQKGDSYQEALAANRAIVRKIKYAFELLKPEGLTLLRHWVEGDEFDYRALIEAAIDFRMGQIPSERLYIKRLKLEREVAVLLLVDLSRSTANTVGNTLKTVLNVEREAIVLFCEALQTVGDTFAIAGFSGTGRLSVDYWWVKEFSEPLNEEIKARINAMAPQRGTRMGAAIRHAVACLEKVSKKTRLLIVLGDGFPNDVEYKGDYAVADTRRAISEATAKGVYCRPITVNFQAGQELDRMYGDVNHTVIADVRDLPDNLWRIYRSLTK
jgi:nitric oxide reductase NorD protein